MKFSVIVFALPYSLISYFGAQSSDKRIAQTRDAHGLVVTTIRDDAAIDKGLDRRGILSRIWTITIGLVDLARKTNKSSLANRNTQLRLRCTV